MYTAANSVPIHICNSIEADDENGGWLGRVGKDTNQGLQYGNRTDLMKTERIGWFLIQISKGGIENGVILKIYESFFSVYGRFSTYFLFKIQFLNEKNKQSVFPVFIFFNFFKKNKPANF
jgi:hypothetical protein